MTMKTLNTLDKLDIKRGSSSSHLSNVTVLSNYFVRGAPAPAVVCCNSRFLKADYLSNRGRWLHLTKLLSVIFIPIVGCWIFVLLSLVHNVYEKDNVVQAQTVMMKAINLGRLIYTIQQERDMSVLYISSIGLHTRSFLLKAYDKTDEDFSSMWNWPKEFSSYPVEHFQSKSKLMAHINQHRNSLSKTNADVYGEIKFYSEIVEVFMNQLIGRITERGFENVWKTLVVFQKMTQCLLDAGTERAYGVMFYGQGNFRNSVLHANYHKTINRFNYSYKSSTFYSDIVDPLTHTITEQRNNTETIRELRQEIMYSNFSTNYNSIDKAQSYYDSISYRLIYLKGLQDALAARVIRTINITVQNQVEKIIIYGVTATFVILFCPVITFFTETLTRNMQNYSKLLVNASDKLKEEKSKTDTLVHQMLPKQVAERLKNNRVVDSEYFKSSTVMFTSIVEFSELCMEYSPLQIVNFLNALYTTIDENIGRYDVYKVETINDTYMVVSGVPKPNGSRHASEIARLALDIIEMSKENFLSTSFIRKRIQLQIGINTGAVSAGVVGTTMPRYCLFGDTVNTASRMKFYSQPDKIHISESTFKNLTKTGMFNMISRGSVYIKGKGNMNTYWLVSCVETCYSKQGWSLPGEVDSLASTGSEYRARSNTDRGFGKMPDGRWRKTTTNTSPARAITHFEYEKPLTEDRVVGTPPSNPSTSVRRCSHDVC